MLAVDKTVVCDFLLYKQLHLMGIQMTKACWLSVGGDNKMILCLLSHYFLYKMIVFLLLQVFDLRS